MENSYSFQSDVKELLNLVANALYSNKEIFLRELISNSSDAIDKLRYEAVSNSNMYENETEYKILIEIKKEEKTVIISDNGIGMTTDEIIQNLGTIARSGTKEFINKLGEANSKDSNLIGQFGVGFYSSFIISDKVVVETRKAGTDKNKGTKWVSDGKGEFTVEQIDKETKGTTITLYLKNEEEEFLDEWKIKNIIKKYSDHIPVPIILLNKDNEQINKAVALWTMNKKDITDEEYKELYKHISHDFEDPVEWIHNRVEGKFEYTTLLYIPSKAPFDLFMREKKYGLKLYVQRVFIMDDAEQLIPNYLRFIKGIVDSKDLPLNISREILQSNKIIETIRAGITKRILETLENISREDSVKYLQIWKSFGRIIKEGICEDYINKDRISEIVMFASTNGSSSDQNVLLNDYLSRMKSDQGKIYYLISESYGSAKNSPHLDIFLKNDIEVLLMSDPIDEWMMGYLTEYKGKKFQSVTQSDLEVDKYQKEDDKKKIEESKDEYSNVIKRMKDILGDKIKDIRISKHLVEFPSCIVMDSGDASIHMQKIMKMSGHEFPQNKPILEINPTHSILEAMKNESDDTRFKDWTEVLYSQAILTEGEQLEDPASFIKKINRLLTYTHA